MRISGHVTHLGKTGLISIEDSEGKGWDVINHYAIPLMEHDSISVQVKKDPGSGVLTTTDTPLASIPVNRDMVINYILRACRSKNCDEKVTPGMAEQFYDSLSEFGVSIEQNIYPTDSVADYLTKKARETTVLFKPGVSTIISNNSNLGVMSVECILKFWYANWGLRRLKLLGMTHSEIEGCNACLNFVYHKMLTNPFYLPSYPMEKAIRHWAALYGKEPTPEQSFCGRFVRKIYFCNTTLSWTAAPGWLLRKEFGHYLGYAEELEKDYDIKFTNECAYLPYTYRAETKVLKFLDKKILKQTKISKTRKARDEEKINKPPPIRKNKSMKYSPSQNKAINESLENHITIITGGAGTGKSSILVEIVAAIRGMKKKAIVTSFTGKAVARLEEVFQEKVAFTMDLLIRRDGGSGLDYLIIDEISMVTVELMYRFLIAFPGGDFKVIFIGDPNQLPPVGWGFLLVQMIYSKRIPVITLTENFRIQKNDSGTLLQNANGVIKNVCKSPFNFIRGSDFEQIDGGAEQVTDILKELKENGMEYTDVTIITPFNKYLTDLNHRFQEVFIPGNQIFNDQSGKSWRQGDRVMMTKNNYQINVMNGEEGVITHFDTKGGYVFIVFKDGEERKFKRYMDPSNKEDGVHLLRHITQSYAISVHKSQGSEYPYTIVYIPPSRSTGKFLNVNLFYTALTRAKNKCYLIGDPTTIGRMSITVRARRYDNLAVRLMELRKDDENNEEAAGPGDDDDHKDAHEPDAYLDEDMPFHDDEYEYPDSEPDHDENEYEYPDSEPDHDVYSD